MGSEGRPITECHQCGKRIGLHFDKYGSNMETEMGVDTGERNLEEQVRQHPAPRDAGREDVS